MAAAELLEGRLNLLLLDVGVLFILGAAWKSLPGELALEEVQNDVTDGLQVVSSGLLNALVRRNGGVSGRASKILAVLVGNVLTLTVFVAFGEAEVDNVDLVASGFGAADQEVVGFDISVDDPLIVHFLDATD